MSDPGDVSLGLESLKGFGGKMVQAVLGFVGTVLFARLLGPTSFGGFYLLVAVLFVADRSMLGFALALKKRYSEAGARRSELFGAVLAANAVLLAVATAGALLLRDRLVDYAGFSEAPVVFVALFASMAVFFPFQYMISGEGWVGLETWNDTLRSVFTFGLQLAFVLAGLGAAGMGYGLAAATVLVVPVAYHYLRVRPAVPSRETLASMWRYARFSVPLAFVTKVYDRFDVILIGAVLTAGAAGQYEVAYKLTVPATFVSGVVTSGMMAKVSNLHSRDEDVATDVSNAAAFVSILAIPIFFGALAVPEAVVVTTYGPEYEAAGALIAGLAAYQVVATQTAVGQQTLSGLDLPQVTLGFDVATLAFNVALGLALVGPYGAFGVVVATVLAESARYVMTALAVRRHLDGVELLPRPVFEQLFAGALMFVVVELLARRVAVRSWLELGVVVGTGAAVYGLVLLAVSEQLRFTIRSIYADAVGG